MVLHDLHQQVHAYAFNNAKLTKCKCIMSLEISIKESSAGLSSERATERKRCAETLKSFLTGNAAPFLLCENTLKRKGYCWNNLYEDVHEYVLKEIEKFPNSKTFESQGKPLATSLLHMVVAGSNKGRAHIKCEIITNASLFILRNKQMTKAIGDAYLSVLYKYVVNNDHFLGHISPQTWQDLLEVAILCCGSKSSSLDYLTKLRLVSLILQNGRNCCQFAGPMRAALPKLHKHFLNPVTDKKVQEVLIEIITVLLTTLSTEYRLSTCEFTESILPYLLKFYDQNVDSKKKANLFKLMSLIVTLHHPDGRLQMESGSLADCWDTWNKHLNSLLELIHVEGIYLQKSFDSKLRFKNDMFRDCEEYFSMAALVYYQIFNKITDKENDENEAGNSSKRQKLVANRNKTFADLIDEFRLNHVPWLGVLTVYVKKYSKTVSVSEYKVLLNIIEKYLSSNKDKLCWKMTEELTCTVLESLLSHSETRREECEWDSTLVSLWNSCCRNSTLPEGSHQALHTIIQCQLNLKVIDFQAVQPLVKLYFEKAMPLTEHSVKTLCIILHAFFSKYNNLNDKTSLGNWIIEKENGCNDTSLIKDLLLRLVINDNVEMPTICVTEDSLYDIILENSEKCTLFSEFEIEIGKPPALEEKPTKKFEVNKEIDKLFSEAMNAKLTELSEMLKKKETPLLAYAKVIKTTLTYCNMLLKYTNVPLLELRSTNLYKTLKNAIELLFSSLTEILNIENRISEYTELLRLVEEILSADHHVALGKDIRQCIEADFFHSIHKVISNDVTRDNTDASMGSDDFDEDDIDIRHYCIRVLAAYSRCDVGYREEILDLILDSKLYNFCKNGDVECSFDCMKMLTTPFVEKPPVETIFTLMQYMCKELFRNPKATGGLLKILLLIVDQLWTLPSSTMRDNCCIMINGYLQRAQKLFYPPDVAALIYECLAKIELLNRKHNFASKSNYIEALMAGTKGDCHALRLYCCYMLKEVAVNFGPSDVQSLVAASVELFLINASGDNELLIRDESANRTFTFLHIFYSLALAKNTLIKSTLRAILKVHKEKSLNTKLVKKVMNKITNAVDKKCIEEYWNNDILALLHIWLAHYKLEDVPLSFLGYNDLDMFLERNLKWVVPTEILWSKNGDLESSEVLPRIARIMKQSKEDIIEICFCNIIVLCLPYIVTEKYKLSPLTSEKQLSFAASSKSADRLFQGTRTTIGTQKWSNMFIENLGELILLTATHLADYKKAKITFGVDVPRPIEHFYYPVEIYTAILKYFGELFDHNIMEYLCDNQPLAISKIIVRLWEIVLEKILLEHKTLALHTYIKVIESIPLGYATDSFVCNFVCSSVLHTIEKTHNSSELKVFIETLKILLHRFLPSKHEALKETVARAVSLLMIKKEEGFENECKSLLEYLISSADHTDGVEFLSQNIVNKSKCSVYVQFHENLKSYLSNLSCPSLEILCNMCEFLKANKEYIIRLWQELNFKGFSEDCQNSLLHKLVNALNHILVSVTDNKTVIEACNCLSVIGTYDLKTLVMSTPAGSNLITDMQPSQYFAIKVLECLTKILFDENPSVVSQVMMTISRLLKYREGKTALELGTIKKQILEPFLPSDSNYVQAKFELNEAKFKGYRNPNFWIPKDNESHLEWITRLTTTLSDVIASPANYVPTLTTVCKLKPNLSRSILPPLIGLVLNVVTETQIKAIGLQINTFLVKIWEQTFYDTSTDDSETVNFKRGNVTHDLKMMIRDVLEVINFVRWQRSHYMRRPEEFETLNYLKLEYDKVAWAASSCDNSLAALYYGELWTIAKNQGVPPNSPEATMKLEGGDEIQSIFRKCFTSIGELDAICGCGSGHLTSESEKRKHLINTGQYSDALLVHDIALSYHGGVKNEFDLQFGVIRSLHESGMHHLALQYMKSLPQNEKLDDIKFECLSFLGDWTVFVDTHELETKYTNPEANMESALKALRYSCLKDCLNLHAVAHNFESKLVSSLSSAKMAVSKLCQKLNLDNCQSVYNITSNLQLFNDIEEYYLVRRRDLSLKDLLNNWQVDKIAPFQDFKHIEALISQRSLILEHATNAYMASNMHNEIMELQLRYAELGLSNQRIQLSQRLLSIAKKCHSSGQIYLVEGQIAWARNHKDIALSLLRDVMCNESQDVKLNAATLRQYGTWMAEARCENSRDIIDNYLKRSLDVLGKSDHADIRIKIYSDIAKFADAEYKQVVSYMKSSIFENKIKCMETMKDAANSLRSTQNTLNKDERKAMVTNERLSILDEADINSTIEEKKRFLELAMRYYLLSLQQGEESNLTVFRVISLWFDNPNFELEQCTEKFSDLLKAVPSRKYVPVLPQLAPRLTVCDDAFAKNLNEIMKRCAVDHPHHTLPILFGLRNSDKDSCILNAGASLSRGKAAGRQEEARVLAARNLIMEFSKEGVALARIIGQMDRMCDAIISFANFKTKLREMKQSVPKSELIYKLGNLESIPIPTISLSIQKSCVYNDFPGIVSFADTFELVGGINCPKKMICKGTDGKNRTLLIKGEDDLRQDAVMQQVFNIVNTLLELNPVTSRNKLSIRTYKVVALSRRSGVLEWCEGTIPLGLYLVGHGNIVGAHRRYRPKDISCSAARAKLTMCHEKGKSNADKLATYLKILREFKPVFHYFFTEHYLDPVTWYERRLAYTKSVATSSMVGYIMGLGDRHVQNILIDKRSAEVIHIDFGIAFDQGKALPTPEMIPFRLTQDIIAGFGPSGYEGIFRRCCEKTMQLLRDNQEALLTILEVLLCDPLYSWTVTPAEAKRKQNLTATPRDAAPSVTSSPAASGGLAERALLAVSSKLSGAESGAGGVAVAGQVARLIRCATDPTHLSRLFPGWQPYL